MISDPVKIERWTGPAKFIADGKEYIDLSSGGIFAAVLGPCSETIQRAMVEPQFYCAYGSHFRNDYAERLKAALCELTGFEACLLFSTGSEAAEAWWRACRTYNGRPMVWGGLVDPDTAGDDKTAIADAMHGWTLGSLIMAGKLAWPQWGLGWSDLLGHNRFGKSHDMTSCAIWEPYHAPSAQFHRPKTISRLIELKNSFEKIPHCSDEVQGGLGRTGKLFGWQWYEGLKPDAVCIGKALGGGLPISALLGPAWLGDPNLIESACLHSTHSDNPAMASVALAVLHELKRNSLIDRSHKLGLEMAERLKAAPVRVHAGRGLLAGIEMADADQADQVVDGCRRRGVWVIRTGRKWVKLGPCFVIPEDQLFTGLDHVLYAVQEVVNATGNA